MLNCPVLTKKVTQNKTKNLLPESEFNQLKIFDSDYFIGKSYFEEDGTHNYLVFQPMNKYFKIILVILILFYHGLLMDCLMKKLHTLLHLISFLVLH